MYGSFTVLYADAQIAVAVKPFGMVSEDTGMIAALKAYFMQRNEPADVYLVHRLDRETGGVMVFARTREAAAYLSKQIQNGGFEKIYTAEVQGAPEPREATLADLLFHDRQRNKTYTVKKKRKGVKEAILRYAVAEAKTDTSLLRIRLETGRTHQIRVQMATRAHPIVGDGKYGGKKAAFLHLWAGELSFPAPNGERLRFQLPAPF
ncbi:MAG: RluA family pseudouridine synthase [Clostridia bacterium]|nr:RluA family pseudouridine synthase [Clostridia bacterium]